MSRHFTKDMYMANKHMKRHSASLIIREIQIKWLLVNKQKITNIGKNVEKLEPLCTASRNVK